MVVVDFSLDIFLSKASMTFTLLGGRDIVKFILSNDQPLIFFVMKEAIFLLILSSDIG